MILPITDLELFEMFNLTPDLVCIAGKDGFFRNINKAVIDTLGYSKEELFSRPISEFIHPEDQLQTRTRRAELLLGKPLTNFDNRYITKSGHIVWLHWTSIYIAEKELVFAIAKDITAKKQQELLLLENYNKFKGLATHFKSTLEKDKKFLAIELHEEIAQLASVIKMNVDWLSKHELAVEEPTIKRIGETLSLSQVLIDSVRQMSYTISPHMLEELGLQDTLHWLCHQFQKKHSISCHAELSFNEKDVKEIKIDLFRLCQDALECVMYPEQAKTVLIEIIVETQIEGDTQTRIENGEKYSDQEGCPVSLLITGTGIKLSQNSFEHVPGLRSMRERVASLDGSMLLEDTENGSSIIINFLLSAELQKGLMNTDKS